VQDMANATALEALAGGRLHQVVVDNEKTGMLLLTKGGLQRRVTLIPLNKIKATTASPAQLQQVHKLVGDRAVAAVSLISCAAELQPARRAVGCPPRRRTPPCGAWVRGTRRWSTCLARRSCAATRSPRASCARSCASRQ